MGKMGSNIPAFFLLQEKIRVKRKSFTKLKLLYLPVTFEVHRCNLIFCDENVGEIQYEIIGIPQYPQSLDNLKINTYIDSTNPIPMPISLANVQVQSAYYKLVELSKNIKDETEKETLMKFVNQQKTEETFSLEVIPSQNITCPPLFTIFDENIDLSSQDDEPTTKREKNRADEKARRKNVTEDPNIVKLGLTFRNPVKEYTATVILKNHTLTDLRLYD